MISGSELGIAEDEATLQHSFALHPPFPNPASDVTNLTLDITDAGKYDVNIYDITGRMIRHLPLKFHLKGRNTFQWDLKNDEGTRVSTGTYIISVHNIHGERTYQRIVVM